MADVEDDEKFLYGGEILLYTPECMLYFLPSVEISVAFSSCLLTLRQINITEFANYSVKSCRTYKVHLRLLSISIAFFFPSNLIQSCLNIRGKVMHLLLISYSLNSVRLKKLFWVEIITESVYPD